MFRDFIDSLGGRKFFFAGVIIAMIFTLTILKIDYSKFIQDVMVIYGLFVGGNVIQKFAPIQEEKIEVSNQQ